MKIKLNSGLKLKKVKLSELNEQQQAGLFGGRMQAATASGYTSQTSVSCCSQITECCHKRTDDI